MITDEKRREVAARLRGLDGSVKAEIESRMARLPNKDLAATLVSALGLAAALAGAGFDTRTGGDLWKLMADLIDRPTCSNLMEPRGMAPVETDDWFECSGCHCKVRQNAIGMAVCYCPHCGAEVVRREGA